MRAFTVSAPESQMETRLRHWSLLMEHDLRCFAPIRGTLGAVSVRINMCFAPWLNNEAMRGETARPGTGPIVCGDGSKYFVFFHRSCGCASVSDCFIIARLRTVPKEEKTLTSDTSGQKTRRCRWTLNNAQRFYHGGPRHKGIRRRRAKYNIVLNVERPNANR